MNWRIVPANDTERLFGIICPKAEPGARACVWRENGWTVWVYEYKKSERHGWPTFRARFCYWVRRESDHSEWAGGADLLRDAKSAGLAKLTLLKAPDSAPKPRAF
jgi:hypothetical protein